jgi:PAS domain S-box-containing protein
MSFASRSALLRYGCAVFLAMAAIALRAALDPLWGSALPLITFSPAIMASAWLGGFGPGLTTTLLTAVGGNFLWLRPDLTPRFGATAEAVALAAFVAIGVLISVLTETLHRSERRQAAALALEQATRGEIERGREAAAALAAIVRDTDDAIVSKTLDGVITSWNPAAERLFGYTAAEAVGQPIALILPPDRLDEERDILRRLQGGENVSQFETERRRQDGRSIPVSLTISRVTDTTGRVVGASKIARDITERKLAEAARREIDRQKDQFLAIVSHEMRNPLGAIMAAASVLATDRAYAEMAPRPLDIIRRQTEHLARLVDDLLDVARLSTGKIALQRARVDLADATTAHVTAIARGAGAPRIALAATPAFIQADPDRVQQIVGNLVGNALKVHPVRRRDPGHRRTRRPARRAAREGFRHRHRARALAARVRAVHAGRVPAHAPRGRPRHRAHDRAPSRGAARREDRGPQRRPRARLGVRRAVSRRRLTGRRAMLARVALRHGADREPRRGRARARPHGV